MRLRIARHIVFTASGIGLTFGVLSWLRSENIEPKNAITSYKQRLRDAFKQLKKKDESFIGTLYRDLKYQWDNQSQGQKLALGIIGINSLIFGLWQIPRMSVFMHKYFVHDPSSGRVLTLLTSAYTFNMYALHGFLPLIQIEAGMSWEQTLAFYNSAALAASLASHVGGILLARYKSIIPSLGASGGIWALLAGTAVVAPYMKVGIIFIPGLSFTISELIPFLMAFDAAGIILRWRTFDHIAHLSGAGFGILYLNYGRDKWLEFQRYLKKKRMQFI